MTANKNPNVSQEAMRMLHILGLKALRREIQ